MFKSGIFPVFFSLVLMAPIDAQVTPSLDKFDIFLYEGQVFIELIISSGNTCNGIRYYRSTDGENYQMIGQVTGICGSPYFPVGYDFTDHEPVINATNFYKVEFGGFGFSKPVPVKVFDLENSGSRVVPNPVNTSATIYFDNPGEVRHQLFLNDVAGRTVLETEASGDSFELDLQSLTAGVYVYKIFAIEEPNRSIQGQLIKK
ncbi:MAG: T9SS C-terminal target domain-containing protein [Saprospirales bacterium]|nr:MAG: T9SS C-terminal target domain-containing protein [Saprospirales bacterium]